MVFSYRLERMIKAIESKSIRMPPNLTREEKRAFILNPVNR